VGNAVSVPVAKWLGRRLVKPLPYDSARDGELPASGRWPKAARFNGDSRYAVSINAYPQWKARPALTEFLKHAGKPLSARATRGFLSRTERAVLRFADGFQDRLRDHLYRMEAPKSAGGMELAFAAE
jgi:DNA (cytosine-5)-methyltransferase 1